MIARSRMAMMVACGLVFLAAPANAQILDGLLGDGDSGALITLDSGSAGDSGLVNLGLGGGDGNILDANVGGGGSGSLVDANVALGGSSGLLDVNAGVGGVLDANVNVGGGGGLIGIDIGIGGGNGNNGTNGTNGTNGRNGVNGTNGNGGGGTVILRSAGGGSVGIGSNSNACAGTNPNQLVSLFQQTQLSGWNRASSIQLVPIRVCAEVRRQIGNWLASNSNYQQMVGAVASDALINAALSRTNYQPGHVLGVQRQGSTLMVYVF
ncbi:hypothetical protein [Devosia lacusdianchii]|uniref:hypothetical protein n=1 Tax=Devosia lacusdianchii TaxID=2917991 RepID=UPI001F0585C6|nr:hypothetical protein [Devosia sp. JXJ CY 41]